VWVGALGQSWSPTWAVSAIAVIAAIIWRNKRRLAVLLIAIVLGATIMSIRIAALDTSAINQFRGAITSVE